ncbi:YhcH/YjgK/YiaL family protein [Neisseria sp. CCUG12390]|uniref:YhcH/YjgK/YiaL family protein n=1 Tax=Neisseria sp. CCUG12390 TaxID=3392035 RepID=UPI003A0FECD9
MITDTIANAGRYSALHPDFTDAVRLLQSLDFPNLPDGQYPCGNPNIRLFVGEEAMRSREDAKPEAHIKHIDIQVPISGVETYGWTDRSRLKNGLGYQEEKDIEFFDCIPEVWLDIHPGEFVLFFPNDGHAPLVGSEQTIRKAVFKIRTTDTRMSF